MPEKEGIIRAVRKTLDDSNLQSTPIIAGIGGQCLQESLTLARSAHKAGAFCGIALSPSFFSMYVFRPSIDRAHQSRHMSDAVLEAYFRELADKSPMPIMIYNFPGVTNGINLSSSLLHRLSSHPNIIGTKLTCNTVSKIQYLHPKVIGNEFHVLSEYPRESSHSCHQD